MKASVLFGGLLSLAALAACGRDSLAAPRPSIDERHAHERAGGGTTLILAAVDPEADLDGAAAALALRAAARTGCGAPDVELTRSEGEARAEVFVCRKLEGPALEDLVELLGANGELYFAEVARPSQQADARMLPDGDDQLGILSSDDPADHFTSRDIEGVLLDEDMLGHPAVAFELAPGRRADFGRFTERIAEEHGRLAIILDERVVTAPAVESGLYGWTQITGGFEGFTESEARDLMLLIQTGPLGSAFELVETRSP